MRKDETQASPKRKAAPSKADKKRKPASKKTAPKPRDKATEAVAGEAKADQANLSFAPGDLISGFASSTSRIVQKAASILEEEIAMGILAAKQIEEKFVDVPGVRAAEPDEVVSRFRKDAHEVVDILMDLVSLATKSVASLTDRVVRLESRDRGPSAPKSTDGVPTLVVPGTVAPGDLASVTMSLENDADKDTDEFEFHSSDLVDSEGNRIEAGLVTFSPQSLVLGPRARAQVAIVVQLPGSTRKGTYAGLIQAARMDYLRAVLVLNVD